MKPTAILIHGWDPDFYNSKINPNTRDSIAWSKRTEFISQLEKQYYLTYFNLPGFCGIPEPGTPKFDIEEFTDYFVNWKRSREIKADILIGYSFGGAILLDYKARYKDKTPTVLIAPAIYRGESVRSFLARKFKHVIPNVISKNLKHLYQFITSKYYRDGSSFLRKSYDIIARRDLRSLLEQVDTNELFLIYGTKDDATPWNLVKEAIKNAGIDYHLIANGKHGIGQTDPKEIAQTISFFYKGQS